MKRRTAKTAYIQTENVDARTANERARQLYILKELGLLHSYDSPNNYIKSKERFSKYYETESDYEKDKAEARILVYSNQEVPPDLYEKLHYTKIELQQK